MTRYALSTTHQGGKVYLAAYYGMLHPHDGILLTHKAEDACSYVTVEKAAEVARALEQHLGSVPAIVEVAY